MNQNIHYYEKLDLPKLTYTVSTHSKKKKSQSDWDRGKIITKFASKLKSKGRPDGSVGLGSCPKA